MCCNFMVASIYRYEKYRVLLVVISQYNKFRDLQYEASGHYIADKCNTLLALCDGKYIGLTGGT